MSKRYTRQGGDNPLPMPCGEGYAIQEICWCTLLRPESTSRHSPFIDDQRSRHRTGIGSCPPILRVEESIYENARGGTRIPERHGEENDSHGLVRSIRKRPNQPVPVRIIASAYNPAVRVQTRGRSRLADRAPREPVLTFFVLRLPMKLNPEADALMVALSTY